MARIVLATIGSLGDLHPFIALGLELRQRGHSVAIATTPYYREKLAELELEFFPLRPDIRPDDPQFNRDLMDAKKGTEKVIREVIMPVVRGTYDDLITATVDADLMISGEVVYAAPIVAEKTGIKWISTSLAPGSMFSSYDPFVPPPAQWLENLRPLGATFHWALFSILKRSVRSWGEPVRALRRELGLNDNVDPIFDDKFSPLLNIALFSKVLGLPQKDWHQPTQQTGFVFYDGKPEANSMPVGLGEFMRAGEPPIIFTLGSAAVWTADNFYDEAALAAKRLGRRAVLLIGQNQPPQNLTREIVTFEYAPFSEIFPLAAAIVHQGGVGTTAQCLRAGVPQLVVPFSHDQPDNAARCVRYGLARTVRRDAYNAQLAETELRELLGNASYKTRALEAKRIVESENGIQSACDGIESVLR